MRILLLGGTGWLGSELARRAVARGHDVTCLARGSSGPGPEGVRLVRADRSAPGAYRQVAGPDDGPRGGGTHWDAVLDTAREPGHVRSAVHALWNARQYVFVSSISAYAGSSADGAGEAHGAGDSGNAGGTVRAARDETAPLLPPLAADYLRSQQDYGAAKAAGERAVQQAFEDRAVVVRPGLIAGPGDDSGRTGYWPLRLAHPADDDGRVLVPDAPDQPTQVIDVRDLAAWLLQAVEGRLAGTFNAVGPALTLADHLAVAREVGGGHGIPVPASEQWLREAGVRAWAGPRSLPLWLGGEPASQLRGTFSARRAAGAGLRVRPLEETLADTLAWEESMGVDRPRNAGLTREEERELLAALAAGGGGS